MGCLFYALFLYKVATYWSAGKKAPLRPRAKELPFFSVIIPARNEATTIQACLNAVLTQSYPRERIEVIVADDHSEDRTSVQVQALADERIQLLQLSGEDYGKKAAITKAIGLAKGDILVFTDADCIAGPDWLNQISQLILAGNNMILAPVQLSARSSLLGAFQGLDVCGTLLLTGAAVQAGRPILANGANLAISKSLFIELDGFVGNTHRASGDDIFLLQKAAKSLQAKIAFAFDKKASVQTFPAISWSEFFWQRLRWAGKTSGYTDKYLILFQAAVYILNLGLLLGIPLLFTANYCASILVGAYLIKAFSEYYYLRFASQELGNPKWMNWFIPALGLHMLYVVLVGSLALLPISSRWKGRKI